MQKQAYQHFPDEQDAKDLAARLNANVPENRRYEARAYSWYDAPGNVPKTWGVVEWQTDYKDCHGKTIGRNLGFVESR